MSAYLVTRFTAKEAQHDQIPVYSAPWSKFPVLNGIIMQLPVKPVRRAKIQINVLAGMLSTLQNTSGSVKFLWSKPQINKAQLNEKPDLIITKLSGTDSNDIADGLLSLINEYYR